MDEVGAWQVTESRDVIRDPWFRVRRDDVRLPTGARIDGYYVWESPDIATVVPVTPDGRLVLVRQYRYAVGRVLLQVPAGGVGPGETPEAAARRELWEESGYVARELEPLGRIAAYPTKLSGWHHLFLARDVTPGDARIPDPHEPAEVLVHSVDEVMGLLAAGEFAVADSVAAVLLALHRNGITGA